MSKAKPTMTSAALISLLALTACGGDGEGAEDDGLAEVPDVAGQPGDEAQDAIEEAGFEITWDSDSGLAFDVSNWEVASVDPEAGERLEEDSEVTVSLTRPEGYDEDDDGDEAEGEAGEDAGESADEEDSGEPKALTPVDPAEYADMDSWEALEDVVTSRGQAVDAEVFDNTAEGDGTRPQASFEWPGTGNSDLEAHVLDVLVVADEVWDPAWEQLQFFVSDVTGPQLLNVSYSREAVAEVAENYEGGEQPIIEAADGDPHLVHEWLHEDHGIRPVR